MISSERDAKMDAKDTSFSIAVVYAPRLAASRETSSGNEPAGDRRILAGTWLVPCGGTHGAVQLLEAVATAMRRRRKGVLWRIFGGGNEAEDWDSEVCGPSSSPTN